MDRQLSTGNFGSHRGVSERSLGSTGYLVTTAAQLARNPPGGNDCPGS